MSGVKVGADDDMLRATCSECRARSEVASVIPGRTPASWEARAKRLGVGIREGSKPWSSDDLLYLYDNWERGTPIEDMTAHLKRSGNAIRMKACKLGLGKSGERKFHLLDKAGLFDGMEFKEVEE